MQFLTAVRMFLPSPGLAPWEGMNFCLCSWLCVLSMSRCVALPFWPSQSAHLSSALHDHNDQKLSSWAQSKVSTVQAITKGGLVLLFNKAKTTLQNNTTGVWEELHRRCSCIFSTDCFFSQLPFGLFFWGLFPRGCFKPRACFFFLECKLFFSSAAHTCGCTHTLSILAALDCLCSL